MNKFFIPVVAVVAGILAYLTYESVATPVKFDKEQAHREVILQKQLKKIADAQDAFEDRFERFATRDELITFLKTGHVYSVKAEGIYTDAMREKGLSEQEAARQGLIVRDTTWLPAGVELGFGTSEESAEIINDRIEKTFKILGTDKLITIDTATIKPNGYPEPVFRAAIPFEEYLGDLDAKRLQQKKEELSKKANSYAGLCIGSLTERKLTGNWE